MTETTDRYLTHVWQEGGMGTAPYRFTGQVYDAGPVGSQSPSCQACGTIIRYVYSVTDGRGDCYIVGCECIRKTGDSYMTSAAEKALKELKRQQRAEAERARIERVLAEQRERNGGLTDSEVRERDAVSAKIARRAEAQNVNREILLVLGPLMNDDDAYVWDGLYDLRDTPITEKSDRFVATVRDMFAKQASGGARRGSKRYDAAAERFDSIMDALDEAGAR